MKNDFEKQLSNIKLKAQSKSYVNKGLNLLDELEKPKFNINWSYLLAFCLMLSMAFNWYQFNQPAVISNQENWLVENTNIQNPIKLAGRYSVTQGTMVPYSGNQDIIMILEN